MNRFVLALLPAVLFAAPANAVPGYCFPLVTYTQGDSKVDDVTTYNTNKAAMDAALASLISQGCPVPAHSTHGMNNVSASNLAGAATDFLAAGQHALRGGLWWGLNVNTADGSINTSGSDVVDQDAIYAYMQTHSGFGEIFAIAAGGGNNGEPTGYGYSNAAATTTLYGKFAANLVARYPNIGFWELMNEVDDCGSACSTDLFGAKNGVSFYQQGKNYATFLSVVVPMMKAKNPNIAIGMAGLGMIDTTSTSFIQGVKDGGGFSYIDWLSVHVYGSIKYRVLNEGLDYRTWMTAQGVNRPMMLTEWGDQNRSTVAYPAAPETTADTTIESAYADINKYGLYALDVVYGFCDPSQNTYTLYTACSYANPTATQLWFKANP